MTNIHPTCRDHQPLQDYLVSRGVLGREKEPWVAPSHLLSFLGRLREISDSVPHHLQIWTYAWLALPLFKPFF